MKIMKTKIIFTLALIITANSMWAQDSKYLSEMGKQIQTLYAAKTPDEYQAVINAFNRIASAEKTKWEPYYYSAFGNVMMANIETDKSKKDALLDVALTSIEQGKGIAPKESELVTLEGFIHMTRLNIDPLSRGQQYSGLSMQSFGKALALNPDNPRALGFMAQTQFGTTQFMRTSTQEACDRARLSLEKFATYKTDNPIAPQWGKGMVESLVSKCQ
jgi:hypothetical protein